MGPDFTSAALPTLLREVSRIAPQVTVELVSAGPLMFSEIAHGLHDIAFFRILEPDVAVECEPLFTMQHVVFCRRGHPALQDWGFRSWLKYPHIRIRVVGGISPVDQIFAERGFKRKLGPTFSNFLMVPPVLAASDMFFYGSVWHLGPWIRALQFSCQTMSH